MRTAVWCDWSARLLVLLTLGCNPRPGLESQIGPRVDGARPMGAPLPNCEPKRGFDDYGLALFVASDAQLRELVECRYMGLELVSSARDAPKLAAGECRLRDHSSYLLHLPRSSEVTLQHLGLILDTPEISPAPPGEESGDWPPLHLSYRGSTDSSLATLYEFPPAYVERLVALDGRERASRAGSLVNRLTRFWPELWAPPESAVEVCSGYLNTLSEAARRAQTEHARLFVFQLLNRKPPP